MSNYLSAAAAAVIPVHLMEFHNNMKYSEMIILFIQKFINKDYNFINV